ARHVLHHVTGALQRKAYVPPLEGAGHVVQHVAGPAERLFLFLPGRRGEDEDLSLVGLVTDRYRNTPPAGQVHMPWRLVLEGEGTVELGAPAEHLVRAHRFEVPLPKLKPGVWRARAVDAATGETVATSNPLEILPADSDRPRIWWGEIHGHCEASDGCGDYAEMYRHAREEGRLDFAASADHACYFSDNEWLRFQDITNWFNREGEFVTLVGYEWAGSQGHRNVYTSGGRLELFRGMCRRTSQLNAVYDHFAGPTDVVAGPHTGHTGDFWAHHNPDVERFIEIYSMWGAFEELVHENLAKGAVVGFTGGGDCHIGRCGFSPEDVRRAGGVPLGLSGAIKYKCGMTAAVMPDLTRVDLVAALRDRRTYATTGARILLDVTVAGIPMGGRKATSGDVEVRTTVHACDTIDRIEVIRGGERVHEVRGNRHDATFAWRDPDPPKGENWYYVKVTQADGECAWSSPVWVTVG
ncbi:MAG TPA: CehA/McbA family metallohydrolase, partial [Planctomycetota bacterium]|nr:CehA/McbA family metallohydrolase [Planctomycetota bacterium]